MVSTVLFSAVYFRFDLNRKLCVNVSHGFYLTVRFLLHTFEPQKNEWWTAFNIRSVYLSGNQNISLRILFDHFPIWNSEFGLIYFNLFRRQIRLAVGNEQNLHTTNLCKKSLVCREYARIKYDENDGGKKRLVITMTTKTYIRSIRWRCAGLSDEMLISLRLLSN